MIGWILAALVWLVCGFVAWGEWFGYFQGEYPGLANKEEMRKLNLLIGIPWGLIGGPFTMVIGYILSGRVKHGLKWF